MDDIVVHGSNQQEHDERFIHSLRRLENEGVTLNKTKCKISKNSISFLGHVVSADGVKPDQSKVEVVLNVSEPEGVSSLLHFLGMVNKLGKFIPELSDVIKLMCQFLITKNNW